MAWNVKPSATQQIPRRNEPYLTAAMQNNYRTEILPRYATSMGSLLPILHDVQHHYGYIPYQSMIEIANFLQLKPSDIFDTVSFYEEFRTEPVGKYVIGICQSIACEMCSHKKILDHVRKKLNLEPHETTDDGKFTLLTMECLGACDFAPCALVNEKLHENLTVEKLDKVLSDLK